MSTIVLQNIKNSTQATLEALNAWNYDALVAIRSDDFVFQGLPLSLNLPAMNNEQYKGLWDNILTPAFENFKIIPKSIIHDAETRKSTVHASINANTSAGPAIWELIQIISFNDTGEKLRRLDEFFDSKVYLDMMKNMEER